MISLKKTKKNKKGGGGLARIKNPYRAEIKPYFF
jgi:hypothetical protein